MAAGSAALAAPSITRAQSSGNIKLGFLTPSTGPLALFGETDGFTLDRVKAAIGDQLQTPAGTFDVDILVRDRQSDPNRAADVAADLILNEEVHMLIPASTTDMINPAAGQAELFEVPCLSAAAPWQAVIFPRGGAENPFNWTYHFFWDLDEALNTFVGLWKALDTNNKVGMIFRQNADGETCGNPDYGLPVPTQAAGFETLAPGYFQPRANDFSAQISSFKDFGADIVGGITYVDDLTTFINQCAEQGYSPRAVTVAAALLFPSGVEALGIWAKACRLKSGGHRRSLLKAH